MLRDLGKSVLFYGLASSISKFIGIFLIPIFSRYYSREEYGSIDLISTVISFVAIIGMMQLESAISRFYFEADGKDRDDYISTGFWSVGVLSLLLVLATAIVADPVSLLLFHSAKYGPVIQLAASNILLLNVFGYLTVLLRFRKRPLLYSLVVGVQFFITAVISVGMIVYHDGGIVAFFIGQVGGLAAGILLMILYFRHSIKPVIRLNVLKQFFRYSLPQVPAVAGNWMNSYANRFVMIEHLTIADVGIYTVGLKIASIFNLVDNAFRMAWEPFIWERIKLPGHVGLLKQASQTLTLIVFALALGCVLFSKELLFILSTAEYGDAVPIMQVLFFAFSFPVLVNVFGIGTSIAKATVYNTISFFVGMALNIALLFVLVPRWGLVGVPLSLAAGNLLIFVMMTFFAEKKYHIGFNYFNQFMMTLAFAGLVYMIMFFQPGLPGKSIAIVLILFIITLRWKYFYTLLMNNLK